MEHSAKSWAKYRLISHRKDATAYTTAKSCATACAVVKHQGILSANDDPVLGPGFDIFL